MTRTTRWTDYMLIAKPTTYPETFAFAAIAAGAPVSALVLAALAADFAPTALAHPVLSLLCALIGAGVLYAGAGTGGVAGRALVAGAAFALPLLVLTVGALMLPLLAGWSFAVPDLSSALGEVPGVAWLLLGLFVAVIRCGCWCTHDRAWGLLAGGPLALLGVLVVLFAAAGNVPGTGASDPRLQAGAQRAVVMLQSGADNTSDNWYAAGTRVLTSFAE
jgi:hypothetical protein